MQAGRRRVAYTRHASVSVDAPTGTQSQGPGDLHMPKQDAGPDLVRSPPMVGREGRRSEESPAGGPPIEPARVAVLSVRGPGCGVGSHHPGSEGESTGEDREGEGVIRG